MRQYIFLFEGQIKQTNPVLCDIGLPVKHFENACEIFQLEGAGHVEEFRLTRNELKVDGLDFSRNPVDNAPSPCQ